MPSLPHKKTRLIVGLMSGTSVDGIDAAVVKITGTTPRIAAKVLFHHERAWPAAIRRRILAVMAPAATTTQEICELNVLIAREFAHAASDCLARAGITAGRITALASHGQTICHLPPKAGAVPSGNWKLGTGNSVPSTLQLGDPSVIATLTGIPTVGNFRPADMALGGQGAPLVPFADDLLLAHPQDTRCVQNIGGIANVTYLPSRSGHWTLDTGHSPLAFDTGPGNMLIDALMSLGTDSRKSFDRNGRLASRGTLHYPLFRSLQDDPYFSRKPPKSTGRERFGVQAAKTIRRQFPRVSLQDLVCTATHLTAWSIADAYLQFLPELPREVILCGGGADNPTLVSLLQNYLAALRPPQPITLARIDDYGIPNKSKEAASFAILAAATLDGVPGNVPSVTGATRPVVLGVLAPGRPRSHNPEL
jgi:anhydro-N-acetylmuramic acid kinase